MSKTKRKRYTGAFKAKVGLEALMGVKTVGQIAREYQVHPVQVTQWKEVIREHLPGNSLARISVSQVRRAVFFQHRMCGRGLPADFFR